MSSSIVSTLAAIFVLCAAAALAQTQPQASQPPHQATPRSPVATVVPPAPSSHPDGAAPPLAAPQAVAPAAAVTTQGHSCHMAAKHAQLERLVAAMNRAVGPA